MEKKGELEEMIKIILWIAFAVIGIYIIKLIFDGFIR